MVVKLQFIVEGKTEHKFVEEILIPHLTPLGFVCFCHIIPTSVKGKTVRGGGHSFTQIERDIRRTLGHHTQYITMMFDYYGLPHDAPGKEKTRPSDRGSVNAQILEEAIAERIAHPRFIPYIQLYEFEALLFSNVETIDKSMILNYPSRIEKLYQILNEAGEPENINDNPMTAPSKRLEKLYPNYHKNIDGVRIFRQIPLQAIRAQCPHFDTWISRLEQLAPQNGDSL